MKALTVCQPYAELIARGQKRIENRTWRTQYSGSLLIHAGLSRSWLRPGDAEKFPGMAFGAIIAEVLLRGWAPIGHLPAAWQDDPYASGPYCWLLSGVRRFAKPIPCRGAQRLWIPSDDVMEAVWRQSK